MCVLQMAIPGVGILPRQSKPRSRAVIREAAPEPAAVSDHRRTRRTEASTAPQGGTLLQAAGPSPDNAVPTARPRHEAILLRTPEQEAAQQALEKVVRQCIAGDQQAWQQLVVSQHRRVYAICYRFTGSATDAEDLTQDVFLKVYRNLASFDTQKGNFQTWITTLARNLLVDHFRRTRMDRATDSLDASLNGEDDGATLASRLADPRPGQESHTAGLELKVKIQQALAQLSPELREAVVFRDLEDMDYKEIAQVLRIPEGTVKSRISRGRGELARLLQRIEGQVV